MEELALDIIRRNRIGLRAKEELEKMMGCKIEEMTDDQKAIGLACLIVFEDQWNH